MCESICAETIDNRQRLSSTRSYVVITPYIGRRDTQVPVARILSSNAGHWPTNFLTSSGAIVANFSGVK
jgi:hypothetical protein